MSIKRVLIVDDAAPDRVNLEQIVSDDGLMVSTATNGNEALEKASEDTPDIIFLDILMPGMDGFETCRNLRKNDNTRNIPVVMVSSKANKADRIWAMEQGASGYITKPYTADDIRGVMERFN
ncbi:MAG: response regulator [Xanthomonadales bacterium]|jgi:twitching motility two-component system response regulator PilH|nr:response regulator [Xanthomonadales bacterium]